MIAAFVDKIRSLAKEASDLEEKKIDGRIYIKGDIKRIPLSEEHTPETLTFQTLSALKEFAESFKAPVFDPKNIEMHERTFFHVESPNLVSLCGQLQPSNFNKRFVYARAVLKLETFNFSHIGAGHRAYWFDIEEFVIALQTLFVKTDQREDIITVLGSLANERIVENKDNKFSQALHIRTGISQQSEKTIENPVSLEPYRTFPEISQPEGRYILRYRKDDDGIVCALFDADGGQWKLQAMKSIKAWLEEGSTLKAIA